MTPQQVFDAKLPNVRRCVAFRSRNFKMSTADRADLQQIAAMVLWQQCQRGVVEVDCGIIAVAAWGRFKRERGKPVSSLDSREHWQAADRVPARHHSITLGHGVRYTLADARIDEPETFTTNQHGITGAEVARRLGVTRQAVHQQRHKLGGVKVGSRWVYPREVGRYDAATPGVTDTR